MSDALQTRQQMLDGYLREMRARDRDGTRSAETACPAPVPEDCRARPGGVAQPGDEA